MQIQPFAVEQWMNAHETAARWNMAETCVDPLRVDELLAMSGDADGALRAMLGMRLTYGHITGSPALREAIAGLYGAAISADHVLTTNGAIGANFLVHFALVEPGDTVVCVKPTYQQLFAVPEALGAQVKCLPLRPENGYLPDPDELRALVDGRTRLIVINNPNNPTGSLMDAALLEDIAAVARECDAYVHCDEVYRGLEHHGEAVAPSIADLYEKGVSTGSMSKTYSLAGLRTGWIAASADVIARCLERRDYTTISCGVLDDALATMALTDGSVIARARAIVSDNLIVVDAWLAREPRLTHVRPRAGTTTLVHYDSAVESLEFCTKLLEHDGAFVVPGAAFDQERSFRLGYACARDELEGGLAAVSRFLRTLEA